MIPYDSSFFSEVGGGRSSKSNNFSYNVLHDKVQIGGVGEVVSPKFT